MLQSRITITAMLLLSAIAITISSPTAEAKSKMQKQAFGKTPDGEPVDLYILGNKNGVEAAITNYGGTVVSLKVPDRQGKFDDVVLGYDKMEDYAAGKSYFGAIIGRYGNRIAHGKFSIGKSTYTLAKNNGENTLHGGNVGFNKRVWTAKDVSNAAGAALELTYLSKDGDHRKRDSRQSDEPFLFQSRGPGKWRRPPTSLVAPRGSLHARGCRADSDGRVAEGPGDAV